MCMYLNTSFRISYISYQQDELVFDICAQFERVELKSVNAACIYIYPGGTLLQKSFKIRSWVPSPQMPYSKTEHRSHAQHTQHRNHHTTEHTNKTHEQTT